ncbi:MAG: acetyl-CoA decarbonylase/synthase complex subunit gamma [Planctomycetota bacterium]|nr:acetyl-CoA decarbonylase/synthase complex subunit gamma [Planctomycetota bacterium]
MALTGLDIYKLLPKTNCRECGFPTCLAFAMQLAQKKVELTKCPYVSEAAKAQLDAASAPPIKLVTLGEGSFKVQIGEEQVLFRHDDKFYHETAIAVRINDDLDDSSFNARIEKIKKLLFQRIGFEIKVNLVALFNKSNDAGKFTSRAKELISKLPHGLILMSNNPAALKSAAEAVKTRRPLIFAADTSNFETLGKLSKDLNLPLAVKGKSLDELSNLTSKLKEMGVDEMILSLETDGNLLKEIEAQTLIRRAALKKSFRPLGYPTLSFAFAPDPYAEAANAVTSICKYAGIVVTDLVEPHHILPLLVARQNIYSNPQKPIAVEPKLYPIREPNENSPLMFTTNFSLTYFTVEGEVDASRVPSWILAVDTEGLSVLTAYSGDKLNEKVVAAAMKKADVENKVKHRKIIIPGLVAVMSGALEEELGGKWKVIVGPKEAAYLPKFLKETWRPD